MRPNDCRRLALALDGVSEGTHIGHPDFRVNNRIVATLHSGDQFRMVALTAGATPRIPRRTPKNVHAGSRRVGTRGKHKGAVEA